MPRQGIILPPKDKLWKPLTSDEVDKIVNASFKVLREVGVFVENETILQTANENGCTINNDKKLVYFPEELVNEFINKAPKDILWSGRNEEYDLLFHANTNAYICWGNCLPQICYWNEKNNQYSYKDAVGDDLTSAVRIYDALDTLDAVIPPILDMKAAKSGLAQHVHELYLTLLNTTRHINLSNAAPKTLEEWDYYARLAAEAVGGYDKLKKRPIISSKSLFTPPLRLAKSAYNNLLGPIKHGLPLILGGCNSPLTILNACNTVVHHASVLANLTFAQMLSPGIPCMIDVWGSSLHFYLVTMNISAPENQLLNTVLIQMIRDHLGIPVCISPYQSAKVPDIQASYEASIEQCFQWMTGCNLWTNYPFNDFAYNHEMLLFNNELAGYFNHMGKRFKDTIPTDESIAYNAIKDVGPTADYFTHEITLNNMDLQYTPELADYRTYANWSKDKKTMLTNIRDKLKQLKKHQPPPLPKDTQKNMLEIVKEADHKLRT